MATESATPTHLDTGSQTVETRRVGVFLVVAFGVAWATAAAIYATGGLTDSPILVPQLGLTLSAILLPTAYMFAPTVGNLVARLATGEGLSNLRLRPRVSGSLRVYAAAWFVPAVLTLLGAALYFAVFPEQFDPSLSAYAAALQAAGGTVPMDPWTLVAIQAALALTVAPLFNAIFAFGEEFGWRAYLLPKLHPLGARKAALLVGVVWGVWHWPILAMGYNYGFGYTGAPWTGFLAMCVFTVATGVFLAWVTLRTDSVWPAAIGHGAINAIAGLGTLFVVGQPNTLFGPTPVGVIAALPWVVLAAWLLLRSDSFAA
ncbi:caax amino terminal protease [Halogeometricum borinquense DSM 11551]|uniref:Caax amino terminal protease n=1 Tax=Halogeometricum borinquense (strain ATCC 700274 / DSM 11551 / JCM 10706 / KCTC 4070 / PR3) TaxID=469382 RepID=E4NSV3_HALBP|nr:CPBP family intramembrane glutamic endopeptidase [Halogeometricum borinquense]ADQ65841.1 CAAX amino terminal protease family [Halogeometricum borinquense DSM 11551]ELY26843.1 caax amino terminal protease [Halogeometricum borinquense DSM 11551]